MLAVHTSSFGCSSSFSTGARTAVIRSALMSLHTAVSAVQTAWHGWHIDELVGVSAVSGWQKE